MDGGMEMMINSLNNNQSGRVAIEINASVFNVVENMKETPVVRPAERNRGRQR